MLGKSRRTRRGLQLRNLHQESEQRLGIALSALWPRGSLANELGNLVHRILTLLRKNLPEAAAFFPCCSVIPQATSAADMGSDLEDHPALMAGCKHIYFITIYIYTHVRAYSCTRCGLQSAVSFRALLALRHDLSIMMCVRKGFLGTLDVGGSVCLDLSVFP